MTIATIERVTALSDHHNAEKLCVASVLGWNVVCKKSECKVGDLVVYVNIDSIVEPHPYLKFLESKSYRIKPCKIRGVVSQGLLIPLSDLKHFTESEIEFFEGQDVSQIIKAKHFEKQVPSRILGQHKALFPDFLIKTDEDNLRNYPKALNEIANHEIYISQKLDGCSATYYVKNGNFGVCSRSVELRPDETPFWAIVKKHDLAYKMQSVGIDFAIQGELYGPNIQNNPTGTKQISFSAFNLYLINEKTYSSLDELYKMCEQLEIPVVKVIYRGIMNHTLSDFIGIANSQYYDLDKLCEGIVVRTSIPLKSRVMSKDRWSAKVLNEVYDI
jgi:RNA ligase (TIGR02306 family)